MLAQGAGASGTPVKIERLQLERAQLTDEIARPMVAEAALLQPRIDEEVVELRGSGDSVFASELPGCFFSPKRHSRRLIAADLSGEAGEAVAQRCDGRVFGGSWRGGRSLRRRQEQGSQGKDARERQDSTSEAPT